MLTDNEFLLKDLCARVPYRVKVSLQFEGDELIGTLDTVYPTENRVIIDKLNKPIALINVRNGGFILDENNIKPYFRPLSSMTDSEKQEQYYYKHDIMYQGIDAIEIYMNQYINWLDSNHFDWRMDGNNKTLIERGLALIAPKGMYKFV